MKSYLFSIYSLYTMAATPLVLKNVLDIWTKWQIRKRQLKCCWGNFKLFWPISKWQKCKDSNKRITGRNGSGCHSSLSRWETQSEGSKDNYRNDIILSVRAGKASVLTGRSRSESPVDHFVAFLMLHGTGSVRNPYPEVMVGAAWKAIFSAAGKALLRLCSLSQIITAHSSCSSCHG